MTKRRSKDIGTDAERAVLKYFQANGWPDARRYAQRGANDVGDIDLLQPAVVVEVKGGAAAKAASDGQIGKWLEETNSERLKASAIVGILVVQRAGIGPANAGNWWAVMEAWQYDELRSQPDCSTLGTTLSDINPHLPVRFSLDHAAQCLRAAGYWPGQS